MSDLAVAIRTRTPGLAREVATAGLEVDDEAWVVLADRPVPSYVTICVVCDEAAATAAVHDGAHDALIWPDEAPRLGRAVRSAARAARAQLDLHRYRSAFRGTETWQELGDNDVTLLDVSRGFECSTGVAREDAVGRTPASLFRGGTHSRAFYSELGRMVHEDGFWRGDLLGRRPDGSMAVLDAQVGAIRRAGRKIGQYAIKREAGVGRNGALQSWIDRRVASPWLLARSLDGTILECSHGIDAALGRRRAAVLGAKLADLDLPREVLSGIGRTDQWRGDRAFEVDSCTRTVGDVELTHIVFIDITDRKEEAEKLDALAHDLAAARDQAMAADRAKSAFLASMSHELRTPLNVIIGYAELMLDLEPDPETATDLGRILTAGRHLVGLVDEVLDLARIEAGTQDDTHEVVDVAALLREIVDLSRLRASRRGIELVVDCRMPPVRGNEQRLRQILTNLVSNATKYAVPGRVVLSAADGVIHVEDEGPGLDPAQQRQIFEPFRRLQSDGEGVGLGLAVSQRLARSLGGDLVVQSAPGQGSRFSLRLARGAVGAETEPVPG